MVAPLNINVSKNCKLFNLLYSRNNTRSYARHSSGEIHRVTWSGTHFVINSTQILPWSTPPRYLDFSYDLLNRPQIAWMAQDGASYIYFYDASLAAFTSKALGTLPDQIIIHNDYMLLGTNTVAAYLVNSLPKYRLASDRYDVEYTLSSRQFQGIKGFGYQQNANSLCLLLGYPPIPQG